MLGKAGIKRSELTVINCIQCQPKNNIFPTDSDARSYISAEDAYAAVAQCQKNHVEPVLKARPWRRVDLLGEKPLRFVAQKDGGIHRWRGSPLPIPAIHPTQPMTVPTLHPAGLMRDQSLIPIAVNDLRKDLAVPPENYNLSPSLADLRAFTATTFSFDIETPYAGRTWEKSDIFMVGLSAKATTAMVVPFTGAYVDELKRIFRNAKEVVGHNCLQFDLPVLEKFGVTTTAKVWDTMLLHHLRFPSLSGDERTGGGHDLAFVGSQLASKPAWKHDKVSEQLYCARDVDVTLMVFNELKPLCAAHSLLELYELVQVPLAKICYHMQRTGLKIDPSQIAVVRTKLLADMAVLETKLPEPMRSYDNPVNKREVAPPGTLSPKTRRPVKYVMVATTEKVVPWRSTMMKQAFLYGSAEPWHLGLPVQLDPKKDTITTGKTALDKLKKKAKTPEAITAIDALKRLNAMDETISTFCKSEMANIDKFHTNFNVQGTASGRLSSSDPNLQNIPEKARVVYVPSKPGYKLIEIDYSGIENRLTAWFANDVARLKRFDDDPDFSEHRYLASVIEGIPYDEVEKDNDKDAPYGKAKRIVHGSNYGMGAQKIVKLYDMDFEETKNILFKWKSEIKPTIDWQNGCAEHAKKQGWLVTPFGRRRWFYTNSYYTEALSFLPQSTAADIIYRAMIGLMYARINWPKELAQRVTPLLWPLPVTVNLLLQIHDALLFEAPEECVDEVVAGVRRVMEQPFPELKGLKLPVGIAVGDSWGTLEKHKMSMKEAA